MGKTVLEVKDLKTYFYTDEGVVQGVDGLSYDLEERETLAIVGESGCGKSVSSLSILRLIPDPPGKIEACSQILFEGKNLVELSEREMQNVRGNEISMIFQEPMTSLNPVFTCGQQIYQVLYYHQRMKKVEARQRAIELLTMVGIPCPEMVVDQFPHQLSGGMRQRIMIAMALACDPKILIADEPTTALDVTIQAQILRLLAQLKERLNTSIIMITHDMGVVAEVADNVLVMYAGQAVEKADVETIFADPRHPYTKGLLKSIPNPNEDVERLHVIQGSVPSAANFPKGCRFAPRCEQRMDICGEVMPELYDAGNGAVVRCHLYAGGNGQ